MSQNMTDNLREFAPDLWVSEGPIVSFYGFDYPTRMAIARLPSGNLWVWSPIPIDAALARALDELGRVEYIVTPNKLHHLFLTEWVQKYPHAHLFAPPGLRKKRTDLSFASDLRDTPNAAWAHEIDQVIFRGSFAMEEVVFFHRPSKTALFGDLIQKHEPRAFRGWQRLAMKVDGMLGPAGSTPREWRATFWKRREARAARDKVLAWNPEHLLLAHGTHVHSGAREAVESSLRWLGGS